MIQKEGAAGPVILADAGDSLAKFWPSAIDPRDRPNAEKRAAFLLDQMGAMGYAVMAVGERDLIFPAEDLKKRAAAAKVVPLAANLADLKGGHPFAQRTLVTVAGRKVGFFAVVSGGEYERYQLKLTDAVHEAQVQTDALHKEGAQLVVGLLHVPYDEALRIAQVKGLDYAVQSHDGRPVLTQPVGTAILAGGGMRGQSVGRASFVLDGQGPLFDLSEAVKAQASLTDQERQIEDLVGRAKLEKPEDQKRSQVAVEAARKRLTELKATASAKPPAGRRTVRSDFVQLTAAVQDDPSTKQAQEAAAAAAPERR